MRPINPSRSAPISPISHTLAQTRSHRQRRRRRQKLQQQCALASPACPPARPPASWRPLWAGIVNLDGAAQRRQQATRQDNIITPPQLPLADQDLAARAAWKSLAGRARLFDCISSRISSGSRSSPTLRRMFSSNLLARARRFQGGGELAPKISTLRLADERRAKRGSLHCLGAGATSEPLDRTSDGGGGGFLSVTSGWLAGRPRATCREEARRPTNRADGGWTG